MVKLPIGTLEFHTSVSILGHGFTPSFNFLLTGILGDSRRHPQWLAPSSLCEKPEVGAQLPALARANPLWVSRE